MKKSLIALAVLAASGAALAQSSVTVYGRADIAVGGIKELNKSNETKAFDGGLTTSRLGFRGTEDLGGGLKANFQLESRINLSNGGYTNATTFHGASTVGLSGGFGQVRAGRMTTVLDDVRGLANSSNVFDSNLFTPTGEVFKSGGDFGSRFANMLRYDMPAMGGVYGGANYAFEQKAGEKTTLVGLMLGYKAGPVNVAMGIQNEKTKNEYVTLAGSYDLGMASISAGYNTRDGVNTGASTGKDTEFTIGVNVPMGNVNLSAGYATSETKIGGAKKAEADGFGFGATYALSKRTRLYAGYRTLDLKKDDKADVDTQAYAVGVRHDF